MNTILENIFEAKRRRVSECKRAFDADALIERAVEVRSTKEPHRFLSAFGVPYDGHRIIAEFKRASPSKGMINDATDPAKMATAYERGGACAISVLTEEDFFKGSLDDLRDVRSAVSLPVLRKDFIFDEFQIYEAAEAGADAVLLIVAALDVEKLRSLSSLAEEQLGIDALIEVHTREEMNIAKSIGAKLIGVNNRDLNSFQVSLEVSRRLIDDAPAGATLIAESGLRTRDELVELESLGYSGFLIGETLMRSADPTRELKRFVEGAEALV